MRLALGETQILGETRKLLEEEGVGGGAAAASSNERSTTSVLVKNIPFSTTEEDLINLFEDAGGPVARCVLPPSKTNTEYFLLVEPFLNCFLKCYD